MRMTISLSRMILLAVTLPLAVPAMAADTDVAARLDASGIKYEIDDDGDYKITVGYKDQDRSQMVFVSGGTENVMGLRVREVFSPAARLEADASGGNGADWLAKSAMSKLGSWELRGKVLWFVVKLPEDMDADTLETVLNIVAQTADDEELELTGDRDEF